MTALGTYKLDTGTFPTTEQGLQALRVKPADVNQWNGPYMPKDIPKDAWARDFIYRFPGEHQADDRRSSASAPMANPAAKGSMPTSSAGRINRRGTGLRGLSTLTFHAAASPSSRWWSSWPSSP